MSQHPPNSTLTVLQRQIPRDIREIAYAQLPPTCNVVHAILETFAYGLMDKFGIPAHVAVVDELLVEAMNSMRDNVTHPFRTLQMQLVQRIDELQKTYGDDDQITFHGVFDDDETDS